MIKTAGGEDHEDEDRDPLEESRKVGIAALFTLKLEDLNEISFLKKKFSSNTHKSVFLTRILKSGSRPKGEQFIWERLGILYTSIIVGLINFLKLGKVVPPFSQKLL